MWQSYGLCTLLAVFYVAELGLVFSSSSVFCGIAIVRVLI